MHRKTGVVEYVRTMRCLNCDLDNFLVKTIIRQKLIRTPIKLVKQAKWNQNNLQDPAKLKQYTRTCLYNKLKRNEQQSVEEWTHIKKAVIKSATEINQTQNTSNRNEWWDETCKLIMNHKDEARRKYLQTETRASHEVYVAK
jgi:hypothetical protein